MKAIFISFNQAYYEFVVRILDQHQVRGYTYWEETRGRGSHKGDPHLGTHTWPVLNGSILSMVEDAKVNPLLEALHALDKKAEAQGLRAFVWNIEASI